MKITPEKPEASRHSPLNIMMIHRVLNLTDFHLSK